MVTGKRFVWLVIYLNLPLWIAVGILGFVFGQWTAVKVVLGINILLLVISCILTFNRLANNKGMKQDGG